MACLLRVGTEDRLGLPRQPNGQRRCTPRQNAGQTGVKSGTSGSDNPRHAADSSQKWAIRQTTSGENTQRVWELLRRYFRRIFRGAGDRSRTRDILITSEALYQLSYTGLPVR